MAARKCAHRRESPQPFLGRADKGTMPSSTTPTWFDLATDHGMLEVPPPSGRGSSLLLHVVACDDDKDGRTFAWWESTACEWLGVATVGQA